MALTGHLSDLSLSELIEFFCNQRKTGQLKVLYPQGHGSFYLQSGSVIDARIGVLRGIEAVYYALTLPNANFEFGATAEPVERTINQPWTQVVLEGLRRLDEGVVPPQAFPADYVAEEVVDSKFEPESHANDFEDVRVPGFLSFINKESMSRRRYLVAGSVVVVVALSVAAIGVPAGWYGRAMSSASVSSQTATTQPVAETAAPVVSQPTEATAPVTPEVNENDAAAAARKQREKEKAKAREERAATTSHPVNPATPAPASATDSGKGPKKITVTVTYDESGRVTQASGGDAGAVRIARQKRFPAGKAGSATITIPVN